MYVKNGKITKPASHVMNTSYGEKQVLTVTTDDGNEVKIWFTPNRQPHASLPIGQDVQVLFEQNKYGTVSKKLLIDQNAVNLPTTQQQQVVQQYSASKKKEVTDEDIAIYVESQTKLLSQCVRAVGDMVDANRKETVVLKDVEERVNGEEQPLNARGEFYENVTAEDIRALAISVYIQTQRKFGL